MNRRAIALRLAMAVSVSLVVGGCGRGRASFEPRSFDDVERAFTDGGLQICEAEPTEGLANQAEVGRQYRVAIDCASDDATVVVDQFDSAADRDAAGRQFEVQGRPRAGGAVWTLGPFAIVVSGRGDDDVVSRITDALDRLGAE